MSQTVLIADDNRTTTRTLGTLVERWGYRPVLAFDGAEALAALESQPVDVVVTDLRMPEVDGMELLRQVHERWPDTVVIVATAHGTIESAVDAMKLGAFDYLTKPYDDKELRAKLAKAAAQRQLMQRVERLDARVASFAADQRQGMGEMIGASDAMRRVFDEIEKVAATDATVLILGESGTGKELVAHAIHDRSRRGDAEFVAAHCAAYAEGLLESELFGHEKGAFTGAVARKIGRLELSDGGTLFLDEIGDISAGTQVKLLRVLQEREFERVGGTQTMSFDSRIIAATNRDLERAILDGGFREDLFYRLNVFTITLPPLRQRREDINALVDALIERQARALARPAHGVTPAALASLQAYDWPGNVRELQNVVERAAILAGDSAIDVDHLPTGMEAKGSRVSLPEGDVDFDQELERFERHLILHAYEQCDHVKAATARMLGIDRNRLRYKLEKFGID